MINKKLISSAIALLLTTGVSNNANATLAPNAVLDFTSGDMFCVIGGTAPSACTHNLTNVNGSYFGMDTSGDQVIQNGEKNALTTAGTGLTLGSAQGVGDIDLTWSFGGNPGNHTSPGQAITTASGNTAAINMSGWNVFWNGGNIDMGQGADATVTCAVDCTPGDSFVLDYSANIGTFTGFLYTLHLEGYIDYSSASIELAVLGGNTQECTETGGSNITINTDIVVDASDSISSVSWAVDGSIVSYGETLSTFLTLGQHDVTATVFPENGREASNSVTINVVDTVAPVITSIGFINRFTGLPVTTLEQYNLLEVDIQVDDNCDSSPVEQAIRGTATDNGDVVWLFTHDSQILTWQHEMFLMATAKDQSNNMSSKITTNPLYAP